MSKSAERLATTKPPQSVPATPALICEEYDGLRVEIKALEARKKELGKMMLDLIPRLQDRTAIPFMDVTGARKQYVITHVKQDRRQPDPDKLMKVLSDAQIPAKECLHLQPDIEKVTLLLDNGRIRPEDFAFTLVGAVVEYADLKVQDV